MTEELKKDIGENLFTSLTLCPKCGKNEYIDYEETICDKCLVSKLIKNQKSFLDKIIEFLTPSKEEISSPDIENFKRRLEMKVIDLREKTREQTGAYKYDFAYNEVLELLDKEKESIIN